MKIQTEEMTTMDYAVRHIFELIMESHNMVELYFTGIFSPQMKYSLQYEILKTLKFEMDCGEFSTDEGMIQIFLTKLTDWSVEREKYEFTRVFMDISSNLEIINFSERELVIKVVNQLLHEITFPIFEEFKNGQFRDTLMKKVQEEVGFQFQPDNSLYDSKIDDKKYLLSRCLRERDIDY